MRIKLKYPDVETFIQKYSVNISRGGIFIATRSPKAVGTLIRFEFQLSTTAPIIRGEGQVIWVKAFDPEQPKKVHGMGVRFTRLDSESRSLVDRALNWKRDHQPERDDSGGRTPDGTETTESEQSMASEVVPEVTPEAASAAESPVPPASSFSNSEAEVAPPRSMVSGGHEIVTSPPPLLNDQPDRQAPMAPGPYPDNEVAELWQSSQSNIVRAARHIAELTATNVYYPEDTELAELLKPLLIPVPSSAREASRLLDELLASQRTGTAP